MKENKILSNAEMIMEIQNFKESAKQLIEIFPAISETMKALYEEMRNQGFTDQQAYDYAKNYTFKVLFNK